MKMRKHFVGGAAGLAMALAAGVGWAQEAGDSADDSGGESSDANAADDGSADDGGSSDDTSAEEKKDGEGDKEKETLDPTEIDGAAKADEADSPHEKPGETYLFVGARYRGLVVPKFMMGLFGDGGTTVYADAFGPEFGIRKDNFEFLLSAWFADYSMEPTPFKAKSDPDEAWEIVESQMKVLYFTSDFLWTYPVSDQFGVNYGMSGGFGIVWGDLIREQARPGANGGGYEVCEGVNAHPWCGDDNDHYDGYTEPSWSDGGSKPLVFPWLAFQTGVRYKPHRNFAARLDTGFGLTGFWFGLGADYGI